MYPQYHDTQTTDQGKKAYRATGPDGSICCRDVGGRIEGVENDQGEPYKRQSGRQAELGRLRIWTIEDMVEDDNEQANQHHEHLKVCVYAATKLDHEGRFDK